MTVPLLNTDDPIDDAWVDAVAADLNDRHAGYDTASASTAFNATRVDVTGLSVTFDAKASTAYLLRAWGTFTPGGAGDLGYALVTKSDNTVLGDSGAVYCPSTTFGVRAQAQAYWVPGAGSFTVKARVERLTGTTNMTAASDWRLLVVELGPV